MPVLRTRSPARPPAGWIRPSDARASLLPSPPGAGENLKWYREAELVHSRWAMLGVAGVMGQEILNPKVFWYNAAAEASLPFDILGLVAVQFLLMHWVEVRRWRDFVKPGSVDQDPIFASNKLPAHAVGYPGGIFDPLSFGKAGPELEVLKVKELKNGRLAMLAFAGFVMSAQVTGKGPLANLADHMASPMTTNMFAKSIVTASGKIGPGCAIPATTSFQGIDIPTPCFLEAFWP